MFFSYIFSKLRLAGRQRAYILIGLALLLVAVAGLSIRQYRSDIAAAEYASRQSADAALHALDQTISQQVAIFEAKRAAEEAEKKKKAEEETAKKAAEEARKQQGAQPAPGSGRTSTTQGRRITSLDDKTGNAGGGQTIDRTPSYPVTSVWNPNLPTSFYTLQPTTQSSECSKSLGCYAWLEVSVPTGGYRAIPQPTNPGDSRPIKVSGVAIAGSYEPSTGTTWRLNFDMNQMAPGTYVIRLVSVVITDGVNQYYSLDYPVTVKD